MICLSRQNLWTRQSAALTKNSIFRGWSLFQKSLEIFHNRKKLPQPVRRHSTIVKMSISDVVLSPFKLDSKSIVFEIAILLAPWLQCIFTSIWNKWRLKDSRRGVRVLTCFFTSHIRQTRGSESDWWDERGSERSAEAKVSPVGHRSAKWTLDHGVSSYSIPHSSGVMWFDAWSRRWHARWF
jgi:hypothetical protein